MNNNLGIKWLVILGGFGFLAGFVGPMILTPDANQGPMLGIFITGPLGVLSGLLLWVLSKSLHWSLQTQRKIAIFGCGLFALSIIAGCLAPQPEWVGRFYEIEVVNCRPSLQASESIIDTKVLLERIIKKEKPFFKPSYYLAFPISSKSVPQNSFYIAESCEALPVGFKKVYFVTDHPSQTRDKAVLQSIPDYLQGL